MSSTLLLPPREQLCNRSCCNKHTHPMDGLRILNTHFPAQNFRVPVFVECLIGKQKKPILCKVTELSSVQSSFRVRQNGVVPGPPTRNPCPRHRRCPGPNLPRSRSLGGARPRGLSEEPGSASARNVSRYWGSPRACYRIPCCE